MADSRADIDAVVEEVVDLVLRYQGQSVGGPHRAIQETIENLLAARERVAVSALVETGLHTVESAQAALGEALVRAYDPTVTEESP